MGLVFAARLSSAATNEENRKAENIHTEDKGRYLSTKKSGHVF
jgi:hypothetical protein